MEEIKLEGILKSPQFGDVGVKVRVIDEVAVAVFSNPQLGRQIFMAEKANGNKNISFEERRGWLTERYPAMDKQIIANKLMKELKLKVK